MDGSVAQIANRETKGEEASCTIFALFVLWGSSWPAEDQLP